MVRTPRTGRGARLRRPRWLLPAVLAVLLILVLFATFTSIWTDLLWYRSVHYLSVYATQLRTRLVLFVVAGLVMALLVGANIALAYRMRPAYRGISPEQQALERYRSGLEPRRRLVLIAISAVLGLIIGLSAAGGWKTWLLFANRQPFGVADPQFHKDVSFFVFTYPFLRMVIGYAFTAVVLAFVAAVFTHYLYGGLRLQTSNERTTPAARVHLSVLVGVFVLLKAGAYWLDRYGLVYSDRGVVDGASYTDVNAVLPAKTILAVIAVLCAALFFANIVRRGAMLPGVAFGLLVLSAILVGGLYPALIQQFQVKPNEADKEVSYIARNIEATRAAYGIDDVEATDYSATTNVSQAQLQGDAAAIPGIRLLDPGVVATTFQQLQQIRGFYGFPDALDIDRYPIDGQTRDAVVAVREVNGPPEGQRNWVNSHLVYTHGFGFVAARGDTVDSDGAPNFVESNIPPKGDLGDFEPRIYFGEDSPSYSIVGAPKGTAPRELDFPDESASGQRNNTYSGSGGVPIGSPLNRLLYALKFQEKNILLSGAINGDSRILYIRDPRERVERVAPFLDVDGNPYPAIVGGRVVWILDGYTTSDGYPYSEHETLGEATRDATTATRDAVAPQPRSSVNYIRNSVKATVDAYSGQVTLYQWDEQDPVLKTWMGAFPGVVKPKSAIPADLMEHLRYPEDLFKVQREVLARYHVTQPRAFYGGQDFWRVPDDPTRKDEPQPPYYLTLRMPGQDEPRFSLTTTLVPRKRPNLAAFVAVDSKPGPGYGKIQVLELPRNTTVAGPGQVQNTFEAYAPATKELTLLRQGGANIASGNLLTLPLGGGLLYVEPVYVKAAGGESFPLLQRVLVSFGNRIGYGASLQAALDQVFQGQVKPPEEGTGGQPPPPAQSSPALRDALNDADKAYQAGQDALKNGDFEAYGKAQQQLKDALDRARKAEQQAAKPKSG